MTPELGHFALILALGVALLQMGVPAWGLVRGDERAIASARSSALTVFVLLLISYLCLTWSFVQNDFSVIYVASNSHSELPLMYRLSAVWGAHEGSLLLWVLIQAGWTLAVSQFNRRLPSDISALVLIVLAAVIIGFLLFMLLTSNPFDRQFPIPADGADLNPLLQDPGLIIHPPMLYMGYVGFSVAFAFAIAALVSGRLDAAWVRWTRPWTTAAWMFLTMGVTLGSWWAYNELGWGGWWFWDPVENASFMPWLVGTALIHSLAVTEKRGLLKSWTLLLAITCFSLSLLGTFLVRSGVLVSVHAFATDPARGIFILVFLAIVVGTALSLYAWRAPRLASTGELRFFSREGLLLFNNVFLVTAAATVMFGTLYPLVLDAFGLAKISVGPPYFNAVFIPLTAPLLVLVGLAAVVPWKRGNLVESLRRVRLPAIAALVLGVALPFLLQGRSTPAATAGTVLGVWTLLAAGLEIVQRVRSRSTWRGGLAAVPLASWGMAVAHFGLGLFVLGVTHVSVFGAERDVRLGPGQSAEISGYRMKFLGTVHRDGPNYDSELGTVDVYRGDRRIARLFPEKRFYRAQRTVMTESAVDYSLLRDVYVVLGEPLDDGDWSLRFYYRPMMRLVWLGGLLGFLGGLLAIMDRRYRLARERKTVDLAAASRVPGPA
jgi:cytochrome c-type biogenesis protein CcmF